MANDRIPTGTPRIARMLRELQALPPRVDNADAARRAGHSQRRRAARHAGRRLFIGCIVMAGVALAVATDFVQFRAVAGPADAQQVAAHAIPAGHGDAVR
jgi:hypothetical protein